MHDVFYTVSVHTCLQVRREMILLPPTALNILWIIFFTTRASVLVWMTVKLEDTSQNQWDTNDTFLLLKNFFFIPLSIALLINSGLWAVMMIQANRGYSATGKNMKKLTYIFSTFLVITSLGSFAASIISFVLLEDLQLGLVMVSFFPALVIYACCECCLGHREVAENEETNSQDGSDHHHQEPETVVGDVARSRAEQLEEMRRSREEGRAPRAAYAAAGPASLSCSAPECRWRSPQGVGDLATMVELMRLHTQQAHPVVGLPGGGVGAVSYQGGGGWGVPNYPSGGGGGAVSYQGGGGEGMYSR